VKDRGLRPKRSEKVEEEKIQNISIVEREVGVY